MRRLERALAGHAGFAGGGGHGSAEDAHHHKKKGGGGGKGWLGKRGGGGKHGGVPLPAGASPASSSAPSVSTQGSADSLHGAGDAAVVLPGIPVTAMVGAAPPAAQQQQHERPVAAGASAASATAVSGPVPRAGLGVSGSAEADTPDPQQHSSESRRGEGGGARSMQQAPRVLFAPRHALTAFTCSLCSPRDARRLPCRHHRSARGALSGVPSLRACSDAAAGGRPRRSLCRRQARAQAQPLAHRAAQAGVAAAAHALGCGAGQFAKGRLRPGCQPPVDAWSACCQSHSGAAATRVSARLNAFPPPRPFAAGSEGELSADATPTNSAPPSRLATPKTPGGGAAGGGARLDTSTRASPASIACLGVAGDLAMSQGEVVSQSAPGDELELVPQPVLPLGAVGIRNIGARAGRQQGVG